MNDEELILQQVRKIADLEESVGLFTESMEEIRAILYCIGGPLNDNKLGYSKEQLSTFFNIAKALPFA